MMSQEQLTQKELRGKVAQILSDSDLVINIGSRDGVMEGAKFAVLVPHPLEIHDPDSHEVIGTIVREKVRVEARKIQERLTICSTYDPRDRVTWAPTILADVLGIGKGLVATKPNDAPKLPSLSPEESYVKIGDVVVQVSA